MGSLNEVLKDECKFELLMDWMHREFSSESALCFVELVQLKECMVKVVDPNDDEDYEYVGMLFADMPQSSIVHGYVTHHGHISNRFKKIARLLYEKYIAFDKDNWNMDMDELVIVFDNVIHEVWLWMKQSFARLQNFEMALMLEQQNDVNLS